MNAARCIGNHNGSTVGAHHISKSCIISCDYHDNIIQGLMSFEDKGDHIFINLVENAPFNIGKKKLYEGVPGNLFAFACKLSWDNGNQGLVSYVSKTRLINHYVSTVGAVHLGNHQMVIYPHEALQLIKKYFPQLVK